jgi:hypothetical protein
MKTSSTLLTISTSKAIFCRQIYIVFPATFAEEAVFSPLYVLGDFVKNQVGVAVWILIYIFY